MKETDFAFADEKERMWACQVAKEQQMREPGSAFKLLQTAWAQLINDPGLMDDEILFGDIRIRFTGQLDPRHDAEMEGSRTEKRPVLYTANLARLLYSNPYDDLDEYAFSGDHGAYEHYVHWQDITKRLVHTVPFLFKSGTWMQLLALLFLGGKTLQSELLSVGVDVGEDWSVRAREYAMHMYYDWIVDNRAIHDIQETFLNLRGFFRELEPDEENKDTVTSKAVALSDSNYTNTSQHSDERYRGCTVASCLGNSAAEMPYSGLSIQSASAATSANVRRLAHLHINKDSSSTESSPSASEPSYSNMASIQGFLPSLQLRKPVYVGRSQSSGDGEPMSYSKDKLSLIREEKEEVEQRLAVLIAEELAQKKVKEQEHQRDTKTSMEMTNRRMGLRKRSIGSAMEFPKAATKSARYG